MPEARSASTIIAELLRNRGLEGKTAEEFLVPEFTRDLHDPFALTGMKQATTRLVKAVQQKEKIVVFGDYDADGIPATALLVKGFQLLGVDIIPLIPARSDGYGLTPIAVATILQHKPQVVITVDNGTVSKEEVAALAEHADVIIVDHHEPDTERLATAAFAIINPKQATCSYPFKELCACGLSWKLLQGLFQTLKKPWEPLKWLLDLVAISTIADLVPLVGENRVFAKYGLQVLSKSRNVGLQALAHLAGISLSTVSAGDVGFKIAPRINAPSRMHLEVINGENAALHLLTTEDTKKADELAHYLHGQNNERQALVEAHLEEAYVQAEAQAEAKVLVAYHKDWSTGVIGLVAGRLVERYHRPAIVLAPEGDEVKGSVRSVGEINAVQLLESVAVLLERYGGHTKAAGLTLKHDTKPEIFQKNIQHSPLLKKWNLQEVEAMAARKPDLVISAKEADLPLAQALEALAPFGMGFATPVFRSRVTVVSPRRVGREQSHLSCFICEGPVQRKAIAFRQGSTEIEEGALYEVDFTLDVETWNNVTAPVCVVQHIKKAPEGA
jgi:single-stranded-DNA-specific exonuclease